MAVFVTRKTELLYYMRICLGVFSGMLFQ